MVGGMKPATTRFVQMLLVFLPLTACASAPHAQAPTQATSTFRPEYVVGGHVTGLRGIGLSLRSAGGEEIAVDDDGKFVFGKRLADGSAYAVRIEREPISPVQSCVVEHGAGTIASHNAMEIRVVCNAVSFDDLAVMPAGATAALAEPAGTGETKHAAR